MQCALLHTPKDVKCWLAAHASTSAQCILCIVYRVHMQSMHMLHLPAFDQRIVLRAANVPCVLCAE